MILEIFSNCNVSKIGNEDLLRNFMGIKEHSPSELRKARITEESGWEAQSCF